MILPNMKARFISIVACLGVGCAFAGEAPSLQFGGERIGIPPLSLSQGLAQRPLLQSAPKFQTKLPHLALGTEPAPLAPGLVPRTIPKLGNLEASRSAPRNRVSRSSGMPILEPRDDVDYKLKIVSPDPAIDFKLVIKDPSPAAGKPAGK